jgi:nucleoside-triphosphatase
LRGNDVTAGNLLITGSPGVGKTTIIRKLLVELDDLEMAGFYTLEIREGSRREGFRLVGLDGSEGILSHVRIRSRHRVGKYGVDLEGFETFLSSLDLPNTTSSLVLVDEVGKMECISELFRSTMRGLLGSDKVVVATISLRGAGFIGEVKTRSDCETIDIDRKNRDGMTRVLANDIRRLLTT